MISGFMKNLKKVNHTSRLASLYPYIRGLPGTGNLTWSCITLITLMALSASLRDLSKIWIPAASLYPIIIVNLFFSKVGDGLVNFRRLNGLTMIEMFSNSIGLLINHAINLLTGFQSIGLALLSSFTALGALIRGLVIRTLSGDDLGYSLKYSMAFSAFLVIPFLQPGLNSFLTPILVGQSVGNLAYILYSSAIDYFSRVHGLKPIELLSSMLAVFLEGRNDALEYLAEKLDARSDIKIDCLIFREVGERRPEIAFIIPGFHPGPFRDFGSSLLPYLIENKLSNRGIKTVIVRGLSDHSRNIISRKDCEHIAEELTENISSCNSNFSKILGLTKVLKEGIATASLIPIGDSVLVLVTLHPNGMEDIPPEAMDEIERRDMIVIDSHNSFSQDVRELDGDDFSDVKKVLELASETVVEKGSELLVGYGQSMLEGYSLEDGIGPLGVRVLVFKRGEQLTALVVADSNNAVPEVREKIIGESRNIGVEHCEVLTTDTHIVNGVKLGGRGYHPLGEVIPIEAISSSVVQALKDAIANIKKMEVSRISMTFEKMKVMSNKFLEDAAKKTFNSLKFLFITIMSTLIISGFITTLIA